MRLLLDAGAAVDAADIFGFSPVVYAAKRVLLEPIKILDEADCALHLFPIPYGRYFRPLLEDIMIGESWEHYKMNHPGASEDDAAEIVDTIIKLVAQRCRKLAALARAFLDDHLLSQLQLSPEKVLDHKTSLAVSMLQERVVVLESLKQLSPLSSTVYHIRYLTLRQARCLWEAGFRDMNEIDSSGRTCLMKCCICITKLNDSLELIEWFVSNGADIHRRQGYAFQWRESTKYGFLKGNIRRTDNPSSVMALHCLAVRWVHSLYHGLRCEEEERGLHVRHQFRAFTETSKRVVRMVLFDPSPDSCNCACSTGGCRAYTMMVKYPLKRLPKSYWSWSKANARKATFAITKAIAELLDVGLPDLAWLRREMLRFNIFDRLELWHTCCMLEPLESENLEEKVIVKLDDEEDRCEIRDEQSELLPPSTEEERCSWILEALVYVVQEVCRSQPAC